MHALTLRDRLLNGNDSGIGVVIRDHTGIIVKMYSGMICNRTKRGNELWSLVVGLRGSFLEGENMVILETDNQEAIQEFEDRRWFFDPNYAGLIQQLEHRKKDLNLVLKVSVTSTSENRLSRYLARDEAANRTRLVVFRKIFAQVREIWTLDMGLGPITGQFEVLTEDDNRELMMETDEEDDDVVEILDNETSQVGDEAVENDVVGEIEAVENDGGQDVQIMRYEVDQQRMGQREI